MHTSLPKYRDPGPNLDEPTPDSEMWKAAYDHFEGKRYRDSLIATLGHIDPALFSAQDAGADPFVMEATHGSAKVEMRIADGKFSVRAPFLRIGEDHRIPLMRRVAELNFRPLTLPSIGLDGDLLSFEYETPLELCHPQKVMDVLYEVCISADKYDDEFIGKYNASFFHEPEVKSLTEAESQAVWDHLAEVASEYRRYSAFFEEKNADGLKWDIAVMSMLQISSIPTVNGNLHWELRTKIAEMYDPEIEPAVRLDAGKRFCDDLCKRIDDRALDSEFYHATTFVPLKQTAGIPQLQQLCQQSRERIYAMLNSGNAYGAAFAFQHFFYGLLHRFKIHEDHRQIICGALERSGGSPVVDAIPTLQGLFDDFLDGSPGRHVKASKRKGILSRFFK